MQQEMDKFPILYGCNNCHQEGWIFLESTNSSVFVECSHCRNELACAYCPECDIFTNFLAHLDVRRPSTWTCSECKKEYTLSSDFYKNPVRLYFESDLPDDVKSRLQKHTTRQLTILLIALLVVVVIIISKLFF
jgi:hypothetical protein